MKAFDEMKSKLLGNPDYAGKYVAIIDGKVVDSDFEKAAMMKRVYQVHGLKPIYFSRVTKEKEYLSFS